MKLPDEWITRHRADVVIAFFGYVKSFEGEAGLDNFTAELEGFVKHSLAQKYNGKTAPQLALVSPIAFQDLSDNYDFPNGMKKTKICRCTVRLCARWLPSTKYCLLMPLLLV